MNLKKNYLKWNQMHNKSSGKVNILERKIFVEDSPWMILREATINNFGGLAVAPTQKWWLEMGNWQEVYS